MLNEFKKFALRGNVIDLTVGVIIGGAFSTIVTSLVNDILMPPFGLIFGQMDFSNYYLNLSHNSYPSYEAAKAAGAPIISYGAFLNNVIKFLIVSFAIFILVREINKLTHRQEVAAPPPVQEVLLTEIRDLLKDRPLS